MKRKLGWWGLGVGAMSALMTAGLVATGCTITTTGEPFDAGSYDGNGGSQPPAAACNECLFQECAGAWSVCQNDSECLQIYACATRPGCDQKCVNDCFCN